MDIVNPICIRGYNVENVSMKRVILLFRLIFPKKILKQYPYQAHETPLFYKWALLKRYFK